MLRGLRIQPDGRAVDGINLAKVEQLADPGALYDELMALILKFASFGLIHCDYNEFNIMVSDKGVITVIDFPQMVSVSHENAQVSARAGFPRAHPYARASAVVL